MYSSTKYQNIQSTPRGWPSGCPPCCWPCFGLGHGHAAHSCTLLVESAKQLIDLIRALLYEYDVVCVFSAPKNTGHARNACSSQPCQGTAAPNIWLPKTAIRPPPCAPIKNSKQKQQSVVNHRIPPHRPAVSSVVLMLKMRCALHYISLAPLPSVKMRP